MAFFTFARRLQRTHPHLFLPSILLPVTNQSVPSSPCFSLDTVNYFIQAFRQTCTTPFRTIQHCRHFSAVQPHHNQILYTAIDFNEHIGKTHERDHSVVHEFVEFLKNAHDFPPEGEAAVGCLDGSGVKPNEGLVFYAIRALRDEWKLAFLVFKWGEKWRCNSKKTWSLIIWILGNHKKFNIAWCLIRDLHRSSMDMQQAMLIMIDRYAAANDPGKAIETFQFMEKFKTTPDLKAFYTLLDSLCKHGNFEEAEEFMFLNKNLFPLETDGFNIILNGWCNLSVDVFEAKRVWREMSKCCIMPNATSYTHMISCFSKVGNLFDSLRLYDEMKKRGWVPGLHVYNSLIYILTRENCLNEALKIVDKIKETGFQPDSTTYSSMISPLCKARKLDEAEAILATMIGENVSPTIETYHAFIEAASLEGTLEILKRMKKAYLGPSRDTFLLILDKFFRLKEPENALKIWTEMKQYELVPDSAHYTIFVEGLAKCGLLTKAREFYAEMRSNGMIDDPKLKKLLKEPVSGSCYQREGQGQIRVVRCMNKGSEARHGKSGVIRRKKRGKGSKKKKTGVP